MSVPSKTKVQPQRILAAMPVWSILRKENTPSALSQLSAVPMQVPLDSVWGQGSGTGVTER